MPFKRDFNKWFLFLILVNTLLISTIVIFYEYQISSIMQGHDIEKDNLEQATAKVALTQINNTLKLKNAAEKDRVSFEKKYYELVNENEKLKAQNENIWRELSILQKKFSDNQSLS